ncbi:hypothetical protein LUZ60_001138 [Juncus effusus]|nr:hypothetical protein LUZ60_001138 [Juncus effusus]
MNWRKKLLLVLDSAENEDKCFWDNIFALLSGAAKGSAVLVTTSRMEIANVTGAIDCYQLNYLCESDCWLIFQQLAFRGTNLTAQPELVEIGKHLLTKCACNVLCIKMLGGLLSSSVTEERWKSVLESDLWDMDKIGREMLPVLRVSYEFLPSHLKRCFAYCSLFPKGYIFSKHHLVRLWLAQGFIDPIVGWDLEDIGFQYFEELCSRLFFHHSHLHNATDDKFIMHELIHDLSHYASRNECFRFQDCVQIIPKGVHYLSLVPLEYQTVILNHIIAETEDLQSFIVGNRFMFQRYSALYPIIHLVGISDLFVKVTGLRVLDLSNTDIEELPCCINLMRSLCYLDFSNTKIESIPQEIGNLINLHTLEANSCYNLVELPKSIQELTNLHHLGVTKQAGFIGMPVGIGKLTNLRSLSMFYVGSDERYCGIDELKKIDFLKGCLQISGLENVGNEIDAKAASLDNKLYLDTLSLQWSCSMIDIEDENSTETSEKVLQNLQPSKNIQELIVRNYPGNVFPIWIGDPYFSKLVSIILK